MAGFRVEKTDAEWKRTLPPFTYAVLRQAATERPFSSPLDEEKRAGLYHCAGCDWPIYSSKDKFDSGTGWPSFVRPLNAQAVGYKRDTSLLMVRTAVKCASCGGHLGHVFDDGPPPTGKRDCMDGVAMRFVPT
ncbi:MAG TPA: peptide-methionine (R)-S-oxide reductase MsrB [Caulobacteraceae bacterium]|nr:peptide-methionine (R)-S-oxide reductase MsrB [Caulobacteraceae bacterium]